jgi:WD40 repeat protein
VRKIEVTDPKYVDAPYSLAFSPDGGLLAIGVSSGKVFIFDLKQPEAVPSTLHVNRDLVGVGIGRHVGWLLARRGLASGRSRRRRHGLHINALTRFYALELDAFDEATTLLWVWRFLTSTAVS